MPIKISIINFHKLWLNYILSKKRPLYHTKDVYVSRKEVGNIMLKGLRIISLLAFTCCSLFIGGCFTETKPTVGIQGLWTLNNGEVVLVVDQNNSSCKFYYDEDLSTAHIHLSGKPDAQATLKQDENDPSKFTGEYKGGEYSQKIILKITEDGKKLRTIIKGKGYVFTDKRL